MATLTPAPPGGHAAAPTPPTPPGTITFGGNPPIKGGGTSPVDPVQQSALDLMRATLAAWGLDTLYSSAADFLMQGLTADEVTLRLQDTKEYKARFSGNEIRRANGLSMLQPAEYIATEEQYRNILQQFGFPAGFYDQHSDFDKLIGQDVAPTEFQQRAQIGSQMYQQAPQEFKDYWQKFGLSPGQAIAAILDPGHESLADLQQQANAVNIGGTAAQHGIDVTAGRAVQLAQHGVTLEKAQAAYKQIAQYGQTLHAMGMRYHTNLPTDTPLDTSQQENAFLLDDAEAQRRIDLLNSEEGAQFAGHGGADTNTTNTGNNY